MRSKAIFLTILSGILIFSFFNSCENETIRPDPTNDTLISLSKDLQPIFDTHCVYCHNFIPPILIKTETYKELTTKEPVFCDSFNQFIDLKDPENSFLFIKLFESPGCGLRMPPCKKWPDTYREKVLKWIRQGARNN